MQVADLFVAQLKGETGALQSPGPELVQGTAVENIQTLAVKPNFSARWSCPIF